MAGLWFLDISGRCLSYMEVEKYVSFRNVSSS